MICRICSKKTTDGMTFTEWVRPTFTDFDKLASGDAICADCLFWFDERSEVLAQRVGKEKPQRMRNYSHFIIRGEWFPLSKSAKRQMKELLLSTPFPELAAIAESGQKHIVFRARRNTEGEKDGWVQFEENAIFVHRDRLTTILHDIEALYASFSKKEIRTGNYAQYRIMKFGVPEWHILESKVAPARDSLLFRLALFLAQKGAINDTGS